MVNINNSQLNFLQLTIQSITMQGNLDKLDGNTSDLSLPSLSFFSNSGYRIWAISCNQHNCQKEYPWCQDSDQQTKDKRYNIIFTWSLYSLINICGIKQPVYFLTQNLDPNNHINKATTYQSTQTTIASAEYISTVWSQHMNKCTSRNITYEQHLSEHYTKCELCKSSCKWKLRTCDHSRRKNENSSATSSCQDRSRI